VILKKGRATIFFYYLLYYVVYISFSAPERIFHGETRNEPRHHSWKLDRDVGKTWWNF